MFDKPVDSTTQLGSIRFIHPTPLEDKKRYFLKSDGVNKNLSDAQDTLSSRLASGVYKLRFGEGEEAIKDDTRLSAYTSIIRSEIGLILEGRLHSAIDIDELHKTGYHTVNVCGLLNDCSHDPRVVATDGPNGSSYELSFGLTDDKLDKSLEDRVRGLAKRKKITMPSSAFDDEEA